MSYLDLIIALLLLWALFKGFSKGFIIAAAGLMALILGVYGAIHFSGFTVSFLMNHIKKDPQTIRLISFAVTFIAIVIAVHLAARLTDLLVRAVALGFINRIAGLVFNGLKMALILSIIIGLMQFFDSRSVILSEKDKENSIFYTPLSKIAPLVFPYLRIEYFKMPVPEKKYDKVYKET